MPRSRTWSAWESTRQEFDWPEEPGERVRELLNRITGHLGLRASVDIEDGPEEMTASISGPELGLLIGKRGQTIDAIQFLCAQAAYRGRPTEAGGGRRRRLSASGARRRCAGRPTAGWRTPCGSDVPWSSTR